MRPYVLEKVMELRVPRQMPTEKGSESPASSSCAASLFPVRHARDAARWSVRRCQRLLWTGR